MKKRYAPEDEDGDDGGPLFGDPGRKKKPKKDPQPQMPPHNGTPTSKDAARSMIGRAGTDRVRIVEFLGSKPSTTDEVEVALNMSHQSASPRIWDLQGNGGHPISIRDSGIKRKTRSGRMAVVWEVIPNG